MLYEPSFPKCPRVFSGLLILCNGAISHNWPQIATFRILQQKSYNSKKTQNVTLHANRGLTNLTVNRIFYFPVTVCKLKISCRVFKISCCVHSWLKLFTPSVYIQMKTEESNHAVKCKVKLFNTMKLFHVLGFSISCNQCLFPENNLGECKWPMCLHVRNANQRCSTGQHWFSFLTLTSWESIFVF